MEVDGITKVFSATRSAVYQEWPPVEPRQALDPAEAAAVRERADVHATSVHSADVPNYWIVRSAADPDASHEFPMFGEGADCYAHLAALGEAVAQKSGVTVVFS